MAENGAGGHWEKRAPQSAQVPRVGEINTYRLRCGSEIT